MAKANIARAMAMLDPEECARRYELANYMARETFHLQQDRVQSFDELLDICARYYVHHFQRVVAANALPPAEFVRGTVWEMLEKDYRGGAQAAYVAAAKGLNGGLPGVLDSIRDWFLKDQEERYFNHTVMECVDVMDLEDIETLMSQYLERYGRHLDGNNMPSAKYLVMRYREIIRAHAQVVRNIRTHFSR